MLIAIDAGHGLYTAGKRCLKAVDPKETREWTLNSHMANHLTSILSGYDCEVIRVDDPTGKTDVALATRVSKANKAKADVYVSIHHNAGINGGSGGGICVYTSNGCSAKSTQLQKAVYQHTVAKTGLKGNRATPLQSANFYVVKNTTMPSVLGEFGFMDSKVDTPKILTDDFSKKCAEGIAAALVEVFNIPGKKEQPSAYAKTACERAVAKGIIVGDGNGRYNWTASVSRQDLCVILDRLNLLV